MTYGLGQVGLTDTSGTIDKGMLFSLNEQAGGQVCDQRALDLRVKGEVEPLYGLLLLKGGAGEPLSEFLGLLRRGRDVDSKAIFP
jgi:hypothetical protein